MLQFWLGFRNLIRTNSEGQRIFYPNGILASGYIVPSDEVYKRIRSGYIALCGAAVLFIGIGVLLIFIANLNYYLGILIPVVLYLLAYYGWVRVLTRGLVKAKR